jgi:hypothetical protein
MTDRPIPEPIMNAMRRHLPRLFAGWIDGDDVYLQMVDDEGQPENRVVRYRASPEFKTAVRVCDSGAAENIKALFGAPGGWDMKLLPPEQK